MSKLKKKIKLMMGLSGKGRRTYNISLVRQRPICQLDRPSSLENTWSLVFLADKRPIHCRQTARLSFVYEIQTLESLYLNSHSQFIV